MPDTFDPIPLSPEEIVNQEARALVAQNLMTLNTLKVNLTRAFDMVWSNPRCSAQNIFTAFGTGAAKLFSDSWAMQQTIKQLDDSWVYLTPPVPYTINQDGTVTIGDTNVSGN